jgi:hypothetical protein
MQAKKMTEIRVITRLSALKEKQLNELDRNGIITGGKEIRRL